VTTRAGAAEGAHNAGRIGIKLTALTIGALVLLSLGTASSFAQNKQVFQAIARGTGQQMGRDFGVEVTIESYSGPEDQKILWDALAQGGNHWLLSRLYFWPSCFSSS
jgi:hypothetical protein